MSADHSSQAVRTAEAQRAIQREAARTERSTKDEPTPKPMQAGGRTYPVPPMPKQHQAKPGAEAKLNPAPMYDAPYYKGSEKLKGKAAIITGGDSGIGRAVAVFFAREGADVAVVYLDEHDDAADTKAIIEAHGSRCVTLAGDAGDPAFCKDAVRQTVERLGKLDILVNNVAEQHVEMDLRDITPAQLERTF